MDLSKLSQNEKLAVYSSAAVVIAGLISNWGGLLFFSILAAVGVLLVVFLPQFSPKTSLPGSKGSLMAALGFIAAAGAVITALQWIRFLGDIDFNTIMFYVAVIAALVLAWVGWQELQSEGGKWVFGTTTAGAPGSAAPAGPPPAAAPEAPSGSASPATSAPPPAAPAASEPVATEPPVAPAPAANEPAVGDPPSYVEQAPRADVPDDLDEEGRPRV